LVALARKACAPTDMRRVKGLFGLLRERPSSSSMALSSMDSERSVETLLRRPPQAKGDACVGELPDRPRVEMDMRRRWSWTEAVVMGPGKGPGGPPVALGLLVRPKIELKVCVVKEPRRARSAELFSLLLDMVTAKEGRVSVTAFDITITTASLWCRGGGAERERFVE
jgi:hypothetical protein